METWDMRNQECHREDIRKEQELVAAAVCRIARLSISRFVSSTNAPFELTMLKKQIRDVIDKIVDTHMSRISVDT